MKPYLIILLSFCYLTVNAQKNCFCSVNPDWSEGINCRDIVFKNKAKIYWRFNCDSSWLTFKSPAGKKVILYSMGLVTLTGRLGYTYATEYENGFLIQNNLISGCCTPPEFILFNKRTGKQIVNYGKAIYYSEKYNIPILIFFKNNSLMVLNIKTRKRGIISLPDKLIAQTMKYSTETSPEYLFYAEEKNNILTIEYRYLKSEHNKKWFTNYITVDLLRYK